MFSQKFIFCFQDESPHQDQSCSRYETSSETQYKGSAKQNVSTLQANPSQLFQTENKKCATHEWL